MTIPCICHYRQDASIQPKCFSLCNTDVKCNVFVYWHLSYTWSFMDTSLSFSRVLEVPFIFPKDFCQMLTSWYDKGVVSA